MDWLEVIVATVRTSVPDGLAGAERVAMADTLAASAPPEAVVASEASEVAVDGLGESAPEDEAPGRPGGPG